MPQDAARRALLNEIAALRQGDVEFSLLEQRLDQMKLLDAADASLGDKRRSPFKDAAWILALIATVIAVVASVRVPTAAATFSGSTRKVQLALANLIFFEQIDMVDGRIVPGPGVFRSTAARAAALQKTAGQHFVVTDVVARGPVTLSLSSEGQCVTIEVNQGKLAGEVWLGTGAPTIASATADDLAATEFALTPTSGSLQLCGHLQATWHMIGSPSAVDFVDLNPFGVGQSVMLAPLAEADVTLASKAFHLGRENILRLSFEKGDWEGANVVARIDAAGSAIAVNGSGTVKTASWNVGQSTVDRMPSWFEYFAENAKWVLSYSILASLFGVLWAARKLLLE